MKSSDNLYKDTFIPFKDINFAACCLAIMEKI